MGCTSSVYHDSRYKSSSEYVIDLEKSGALKDLGMMVFIDSSKANNWNGKKSFDGKNLHDFNHKQTPYQEAFKIVSHLMNHNKDNEAEYPVYSYGSTKADQYKNNLDFAGICRNSAELDLIYQNIVDIPNQGEYGDINDAINESIRVVKDTSKYQVVVIFTCNDLEIYNDLAQLNESSLYPLSVVVIGVGDNDFHRLGSYKKGDFESMGIHKKQISALGETTKKNFDNFSFINLSSNKHIRITNLNAESLFYSGFNNIPYQYKTLLALQYTPIVKSPEHPVGDILNEIKNLGHKLPFGYDTEQHMRNKYTDSIYPTPIESLYPSLQTMEIDMDYDYQK